MKLMTLNIPILKYMLAIYVNGYYMATLSAPRQLGSDTKHLYDVNKKGQLYVDKHEKLIENNINKNRKPTLPKKIGGIDDE